MIIFQQEFFLPDTASFYFPPSRHVAMYAIGLQWLAPRRQCLSLQDAWQKFSRAWLIGAAHQWRLEFFFPNFAGEFSMSLGRLLFSLSLDSCLPLSPFFFGLGRKKNHTSLIVLTLSQTDPEYMWFSIPNEESYDIWSSARCQMGCFGTYIGEKMGAAERIYGTQSKQ